MKLAALDKQILFVALSTTEKGEARKFAVDKQKLAGELGEKLKGSTSEDGLKITFDEGEVELSTEEKALLIECLNIEWAARDALAVVSLRDQLNA